MLPFRMNGKKVSTNVMHNAPTSINIEINYITSVTLIATTGGGDHSTSLPWDVFKFCL